MACDVVPPDGIEIQHRARRRKTLLDAVHHSEINKSESE
jgi:hypothetical protein